MTESGRVMAVDDGWVWVETIRQRACGSCALRAGCASHLLEQTRPASRRQLRAWVEPGMRVPTVGEHVRIGVADAIVLKASLIVYGTPLLTLLVSMIGATALFATDTAAAVGGAVGLVAGAVLVRLHALAVRDDNRVQPRLMGAAGNGSPIRVV